MQKNVQIESSLFCEIYKYFCSTEDNSCAAESIKRQLDDKLDKLISRELFTQYKTASSSEREQARQEYLNHVGISKSFRTDTEVTGRDL